MIPGMTEHSLAAVHELRGDLSVQVGRRAAGGGRRRRVSGHISLAGGPPEGHAPERSICYKIDFLPD